MIRQYRLLPEELLKRKEAIAFLDIPPKTFDNFFKYAGEIEPLPRKNNRGLFFFRKKGLLDWKTSYEWRKIPLTFNDYLLCLDFALAMHFRGYVGSDWNTGRQREFGQKATNWMKGQLGEVAVQKFLKKEFGIKVKLDFEIHKDIVPQDIIGVMENGKVRKPKIGIGIKSSKPKNAFLVLGEKEATLPERKSDIYIFCRVNVSDDHLLKLNCKQIKKLIKNQPHSKKYIENILPLEDLSCEIAGWCSIKELKKIKEIPGQKFDGFRFVKKSGKLHRKKEDWLKLIKKI